MARSAKSGSQPPRPLPTEAEIREFIENAKGPVGKRELSRAFGITGGNRIFLKKILKQLAGAGAVEKRGRRVMGGSGLPPVTVLEVTGIDRDGELMAEPLEWDEVAHGKAPRVLIDMPRAQGTRPELQPPAKGDRILAKVTANRDHAYPYIGRIIRRLSDRANRHLGIFRISKGHGRRVVPVDRKARNDFLVEEADANGAQDGELVEIEVIRDRGRGLIMARVRERLGAMNDQRNISLIAVHQHGIPVLFPERVMAETRALASFSHSGRVDLRHVPLLTIDPPDARDHDDAVFAEPDDDPGNAGGHRIIVAIADVAEYVKPQSALDREARLRGNSVYFPDRVVPMLPERISNDLCSLREGEDRPALACFMVFDKSGTKRSHRFERVVMRSFAKLSYSRAQKAIDGQPDDKTGPLLEIALKPLWRAYDALSKGRARREPLELDLPERKLILDAHGLIERVVTPERLDAHKLIEEFMIQANVAAAETLDEKKSPLIYRVHEEPSAQKLDSLAQFLKTVDIATPKVQALKPGQFNRILAQVKGSDVEHLVNTVVLRTQAQAVYSPDNAGHFGLNLRKYAHFTSPIRRYADLIVHRALVGALGMGSGGLSKEDIETISDTAEIISAAERRAMAAERETVDRLIAAHLAGSVGASFPARIGGVVGAGLFVTLAESGADGFVPVATLGGDYFVYDESRHALIGERTGETYQLGDRVEVKLVEATPVQGGLRFEMLSEGRKGKPLSRRSAAASRGRGKARAKSKSGGKVKAAAGRGPRRG